MGVMQALKVAIIVSVIGEPACRNGRSEITPIIMDHADALEVRGVMISRDPTMVDMVMQAPFTVFPSSSANFNAIFLIGGTDRIPAR